MYQYLFNDDFKDFIKSLNQCEVEYILVGGYSVILHGYTRTTGDMDIWVKPTRENYERLAKAFHQFGMPLFDMSVDKFLDTNRYDVFMFGLPPVSIEILTKVKGLQFDNAFDKAIWIEIEDQFFIRVLHIDDLIEAKKAAGRPKDLDDLEHLDS